MQLTCGQGQHAGSVQHEAKEAEIQDNFHLPPLGFFVTVLIPRLVVVVVVMSPFFSILGRNYAQWKEEKQHGFKTNAPDFIKKTSLRSKGAH